MTQLANSRIKLTYYLRSPSLRITRVVHDIAHGMSTGTEQFVTRTGFKLLRSPLKGIPESYVPEVNVLEKFKDNSCLVDITLSADSIDLNLSGVPLLLNFIAGDIFGRPYGVDRAKLLDLEISDDVMKHFPGPRFGVHGIRKLLNTDSSGRPHIGLLLKPNLGQSARYYSDVAYAAAKGGADFIKEDELLVNPKSAPLQERVSRIAESLRKAHRESGHRALYAPNVTVEYERLLRVASRAIRAGATALMINALSLGFSSLRLLATSAGTRVPIHVHRSMHDIFSRNHIGIDDAVLTKLFRIAGGDQVHTGPVFGGLYRKQDVKRCVEKLQDQLSGLNSSFAVISRSSRDVIRDTIRYLGSKDLLFIFDGSVYRSRLGITRAVHQIREIVESI